MREHERLVAAADKYTLATLARVIAKRDYHGSTVEDYLVRKAAARARRVGICAKARATTLAQDRKCFAFILEHPTAGQVSLFENPGRRKRLVNPTSMPDPGPCAWLGDTLEWKWKDGRQSYMWEENGKKWAFLWSPMYKAIVAIKVPKKKKKLSKVSRKGGAAKSFERFASRPAANTFEIEIPDVKLKKLGKAEHIVYRSDKWSSNGKTTDYIHDFKNGVQIFCGPSLKNPEVFLCFGGKLTCTERGLVY
jgi:hypothetical protein